MAAQDSSVMQTLINNINNSPQTTTTQPHGQRTSPPQVHQQLATAQVPDNKGKSPTKPVPIPPSTVPHHLFDVAGSSSSCQSPSPTTSGSSHISPMFPYASFDDPDFATIDPVLVQDLYDNNQVLPSYASSKGKEKDFPPCLPPLSFSDMGINCDQASWAYFGSVSSTPHSYGSASSATGDIVASPSPEEAHTTRPFNSITSIGGIRADAPTSNIPSRRHSLSNLKHTPSLASLTMSKIKVKLGPSTTTQSNLARKLLYGKRGDINITPDSAASSRTTSLIAVGDVSVSTLPTLDPPVMPWYVAPLQYDLDNAVPPTFVRPRAGTEPSSKARSSPLMLKAKGRSKSSPLPFSVLDYVPVTSTDVFKPIPLFRRNYIDQILPKELQIHILKCFVHLIEADHVKIVTEGRWTISKAVSSRYQLVGRDRGIKELFKLARVSRSWQNLVFDGQLWTDLDLHSFPGLPKSTVLRITRTAGPFVRRLNLAGYRHLQAATLTDIANHLCLTDILSYTHLTTINLEGCSALTTRSLHHLLVRCRLLRALRLKGLTAVTNTTCELLATFCTQLEQLNLSRCPNMDAQGIRCLAQTALAQGEYLRLKELRVSGLKHMDDATMQTLGKAAPNLEVLDLSYVRRLHNSALEAFVAVDDTFDYGLSGVEIVRLNPRQVGRDTPDDAPQFHSRRVTKLRHLSVSFCILLTDTACSNIAYAVPRLEFLEMAGIGADLKDDGLIRLLETTPYIRRIDLEDATDISDSVLSCLTPVAEVSTSLPSTMTTGRKQKDHPPQPGHALEWLSISHAGNITDGAFLALTRACPKLRVLEADNTKMSGSTLKEFVNINRQRRELNAKVVAIDCRNVVEGVVKELSTSGASRPRLGVRVFWARGLGYVDGKDETCEEDLKVGQDECDCQKVVVKTFYSWQTVDAVRSARDKRKRAISRRVGSPDPNILADFFDMDFETGGGRRGGGGLTRWWSPNGRAAGGRSSPPIVPDLSYDGCIVM